MRTSLFFLLWLLVACSAAFGQVPDIRVGGVFTVRWSGIERPVHALLKAGNKEYTVPVVKSADDEVGVLIPEVPAGNAELHVGSEQYPISVRSSPYQKVVMPGGASSTCSFPSPAGAENPLSEARRSAYWRTGTASRKISGRVVAVHADKYVEFFGLDGMGIARNPNLPFVGLTYRKGTDTDGTARPALPDALLTNLVYSGDPEKRFDIVFIGDGFRAKDQRKFNLKVDEIVHSLRTTPPYSERFGAFNFWRLNTDSGVEGISIGTVVKQTPYHVRMAGRTVEIPDADYPVACGVIGAHGLDPDTVIVVANDDDYGGAQRGEFAFVTASKDMDLVATHELGHLIGYLGDEYDCQNCVHGQPEQDGDLVDGVQLHPNIALKADITKGAGYGPKGKVRWRHVEFGPYTGAGYSKTKLFRPSDQCRMRTLNAPFCTVCSKILRKELDRYLVP